jgi:putative tryptophan/tyrosine transport system substrate-binding protein
LGVTNGAGEAMRRREVITVIVGTAVSWPLAARAQQATIPVIGFLGSDSPELYTDRLRAFRRGLKDAGYIESENVAIEYRWANGDNNRLPALAAELVALRVAVLVSATTPAALALKAATTSIPIVFFIAGDPVALGLVGSLNQPGANITGTTALTLEAGKKWLQLLQEAVPAATEFAVLINPTSPNLAEAQTKDLQAAARALNLQIHFLNASTDREFEPAFTKIAELNAGGLVISSDSFSFAHIEQLAALTAQHKVPAIFGFREFPAAGGLMSYGADLADQHRTIGGYVGRILKGEKPAELPVEQSIRVQLVLNLKTAKTLGIKLPLTLQASADEVIE